PCPLVISTPVSIVSAIGGAARNGVLIKGGAYLEEMGQVSVVAFDKTGTLTKGVARVTEIIPMACNSTGEVLALAAAVEGLSEHPLAAAVVQRAKKEGIAPRKMEDFQAIPGKGAKGRVDGQVYYVGNTRLFEELQIPLSAAAEKIERLQGEGQTVVLVGTEGRVLGMIAVGDQVRESSREAVRGLYAAGIKKVVMVTGDNRATAKAIAAQLGVEDYRAELLPQEKVEVIKELMKEYKKVAMVGDGVNDAPALASATVGIAMGAAGSDVALETADIALMADDISRVPYVIELGKRSTRIVKQNIVISVVTKLAFVIGVIPGLVTLWMAVLADMGIALLVTLNGMRLARK
ncbi:MAG: heavy metal translocating P-type ATPase, partial [Candidatus Hydrothermarchaeota archaeon]